MFAFPSVVSLLSPSLPSGGCLISLCFPLSFPFPFLLRVSLYLAPRAFSLHYASVSLYCFLLPSEVPLPLHTVVYPPVSVFPLPCPLWVFPLLHNLRVSFLFPCFSPPASSDISLLPSIRCFPLIPSSDVFFPLPLRCPSGGCEWRT